MTAPVTVTLTAAAALLAAPGALTAPAYAAGCGTAPGARTFPLTTRIHGGPATYEAGGEHQTWRLDLTNNTALTCTDIHPVLVLVDERRALTTAQPSLEFYDGHRARPYPVRFEATDADETIGVFEGDGFPGFTVGPGRTVSVKVRLAIGAGAVANEVVANAAVVQRHDKDNDGDWVGESNDYRFHVVPDTDTDIDTDPASAAPVPPTPGSVPGVREPGLPTGAGELAGTGRRDTALRLSGIALTLLLSGAGVMLLARVRGVGRT
ncbi:hypothetical protein ACKI1I_38575 [Streptomyces turgidiscabies]|uniref:hypothetical protein n=1 Tax=Streptomyces TaxID=1883 RepID=UPI0029C0226F|nr:hypothetical protein [Streptomyces turgidiscabies]